LNKRVAKFDDAELWSLAASGTVNVSKTKPAPPTVEEEEPF